jgi:hypothetical protein
LNGNIAKKLTSTLISLGASLLLAACGAAGFGGVRGPSPAMESSEVILSSQNTNVIITALAKDNDIPLDRISSRAYYNVAVAGFNFVDDQCASYFDRLFFVERDRQFAKDVLQAGTQTTSAVLALTGASQITFGVVAQAFGFSSSLVDAVAGTFLYQLPPATTYGFVREVQRAYRSGVKPADIVTPADAYHVMQDYLAICLPPNIEAKIVERVANSRATPETPNGGNPSPRVHIGDTPPPQQPIVRVIATNPVPVPQVPTPTPGALNSFEANMNPVGLARIQATLCIEQTSKWDSPTRSAVVHFFEGFDHDPTKHSYVTKDGITRGDAGILLRAITVSKQLGAAAPKCADLNDQQRADWQKLLGNSIE